MTNLKPLLLAFMLAGCWGFEDGGDTGEPFWGNTTRYTPVLMERAEMEDAITVQPPRSLSRTGKIYMYNQYVFVTELYKGIHIINNQNPSNPEIIAFIRIPGCVDVAVKGNYLYADNATDLLTFNIGDMNNITLTDRKRNVIPRLLPPDLGELPPSFSDVPVNMIIVEWKEQEGGTS